MTIMKGINSIILNVLYKSTVIKTMMNGNKIVSYIFKGWSFKSVRH